MIVLPTTLAQARAAKGTLRAGGTDLTDLRHRGVHRGPVVDLRDVGGLDALQSTLDGGMRIGAKVTVAALAAHPMVRSGYPGLAQAAGILATPQIRARATVAGNVLQQVRCWYFRHPEFDCLKKGGATCFARTGDHQYHSAVDLGPCIATHPSTLATALWAFDAQFEVDGDAEALRTLPEVLGDGSDPGQTHALGESEVLTAVVLPPVVPDEHSASVRSIHRARAEWPLVEATVRATVDSGGRLSSAVFAVGAVANRPLRYDAAAAAVLGTHPDGPKFAAVLDGIAQVDSALPGSAYKVPLISATLSQALLAALDAPASQGFQITVIDPSAPPAGEESP